MPPEAPTRADAPPDFDALLEAYQAFRTAHPPLVHRLLLAAAARPMQLRVLDVGHGTGLSAQGWPPGCVARLVGVDVAPGMLASSAWPDKVLGRAEALPFRDGSFDLLTCAQTFHWLDPTAAWAEFHRVLQPGGVAGVWWKYPAEDDPVHALSDALIADLLGKPAPVTPLVRSRDLPGAREGPFGGWEEVRFEVAMPFTVASYLGWQASREYLRRAAGARRQEVLEALGEALRERHREEGFEVRHLVRLCVLRRRASGPRRPEAA